MTERFIDVASRVKDNAEQLSKIEARGEGFMSASDYEVSKLRAIISMLPDTPENRDCLNRFADRWGIEIIKA